MMAVPQWLPAGTVYGTLLNFRREHALWAPRMSEAPYKAAPKAPVLYVKTANTFAICGAAVAVPGEVEMGATIGLVIGESEQKRHSAQAGHTPKAMNNGAFGGMNIAGCVLLNDLSLPHTSYYRPAIRYRNRDGFLVCGPAAEALPLTAVGALRLEVRVNGELRQTVELSTLVRDAATLLTDVSDFMGLQPGDVLMLGTDCLADGTRPRAGPGDRIEISAPGFAPLGHTLVDDAPAGNSKDASVRGGGAS